MWSITNLFRTGKPSASTAIAATPARPASLTSGASASAPKWTEKFIGKQMVYFDDQFPHWNGVFANTQGVVGGKDFASLAEAQKAVASARKARPEARNGVAYLENDVGRFAAFELNRPVVETRGFQGRKQVPAQSVLGRDDRLRRVEDATGREVHIRGVALGLIVV